MNISSYTLNVIRVIAMTGIVADHYFQASGIPILVNTGLQWGGILNGLLRPISLSICDEMDKK